MDDSSDEEEVGRQVEKRKRVLAAGNEWLMMQEAPSSARVVDLWLLLGLGGSWEVATDETLSVFVQTNRIDCKGSFLG